MSRLAWRPRVDHQKTAQALRSKPGVWLVVGDYRSNISADSMAKTIRRGYPIGTPNGSSPYLPVGAYETRTEPVEDGTRVHARYNPRKDRSQ